MQTAFTLLAGDMIQQDNGQGNTCRNRKYQDKSDEVVSFRSAAHISPENAMTKVCSHEQEQVINAYRKASFGYGKVLQEGVLLKPNIYPEYGRSYISGGEINTQIKYYNEDNPYQQDLIKQNSISYIGKNIDLSL